MSRAAQGLLQRVWARIKDGPVCPCGHDVNIHYEGKCLGANYDRGTHVGWCTCNTEEK